MRRIVRIIAVVFAAGVLLIAGLLIWVYRAVHHVPEFYERATATEVPQAEHASDEMLERASALANDVREKGRWEGLFTEEQINGWLAVDLEQNHGELLPPGASDPRVQIQPDGAVLACRWQNGVIATVLSLELGISLAEPDKLALRIKSASAGDLPLPLDQVLQTVNNSAADLNARVEWFESEGDPVAMVSLPQPETEDGTKVVLDTLELRDGEVYVAGETLAQGEEAAESPVVTRP